VYIAITSRSYSSRFIYSEHGAKGILTALQKECTDRFPDATLTAGPNGLSGKLGPILKMLCAEFNDLKSMDKVASVQAKVDAVAVTMKENVSLAMRNTDRCVGCGAALATFIYLPAVALHPPAPAPRCRLSPGDSPLHAHGTHAHLLAARSIEDIDTKASDLAEGAKKFSSASTSLRNAERWKLIKCV
jgi:hypothetical protein